MEYKIQIFLECLDDLEAKQTFKSLVTKLEKLDFSFSKVKLQRIEPNKPVTGLLTLKKGGSL